MNNPRLILRRKLIPPAPVVIPTVADVEERATALSMFINGTLVGTTTGRVPSGNPVQAEVYHRANRLSEFRERLFLRLSGDLVNTPGRMQATMYTVLRQRAGNGLIDISADRITFAGEPPPTTPAYSVLVVPVSFMSDPTFLVDLTTGFIRDWAVIHHPRRPRVDVVSNQVFLYPQE